MSSKADGSGFDFQQGHNIWVPRTRGSNSRPSANKTQLFGKIHALKYGGDHLCMQTYFTAHVLLDMP